MTVEGPDGYRYLVRRDGSLVTDDDGYPRPVKLAELTPRSARIVMALIDAARATEASRADSGKSAAVES